MDESISPSMEQQGNVTGKGRKPLIITLLIALGVIIIALGLYFFLRPTAPTVVIEEPGRKIIAPALSPEIKTLDEVAEYTAGKPVPPVIISGDNEDGIVMNFTALVEHVRGNPLTPITLIEYVDLRDDYSRLIHEHIKEFVEKNKDSLHWAFRHFPNDENNFYPGQAAECVFLQMEDKDFWKYIDRVFQLDRVTTSTLTSLAIELGANEEEFTNCVESDETYNAVLVQHQEAFINEGISVTPSFAFLNNATGELRIVDGINTMNYMQAVLDAMLADIEAANETE